MLISRTLEVAYSVYYKFVNQCPIAIERTNNYTSKLSIITVNILLTYVGRKTRSLFSY
jgi:hypothetical protein